jgi:carboxymethylenebutenolidase
MTATAPVVSEIELPDVEGGSKDLHGVLARPAGDGPWPAVVMVHEAFGLTPVMRKQAIRMAQAGFLVLMPDLFADGGTRKCLIPTFRAISAGQGRIFVDVENARKTLLARDDCNGRIGVLGFCMGGGFALMAASGHGFDASSANYGRLPSDLDSAFEHSCPVIGSYGGKDRTMPKDSATKLEIALTRKDVPHDVHVYPEAGHAFLNPEADSTLPAPISGLMNVVMGIGPNPESAKVAWKRIDAFFMEHLSV